MMRPWWSLFISYFYPFTSGDCIQASKRKY